MAHQLTIEQYRKQLSGRVIHLEHLIAIKAPRMCLEKQRLLIEETRLASGEYKAISLDDRDGGALAAV